jgi:NAD(P)-dependent dehydrogenase (short-subunit alcohol dehydrogenase family)
MDRASNGLKRWQPEEGLQGAVVFLGSIASVGNVGQISYSWTKAGLEGTAYRFVCCSAPNLANAGNAAVACSSVAILGQCQPKCVGRKRTVKI